MNTHHNALGLRIGFPVEHWIPPPPPSGEPLVDRHCRLERLHPDRHAAELHAAYAADGPGALWTYLPYGPFDSEVDFRRWMADHCLGDDPLFYAIVDNGTGQAVGVASYLRIDPKHGVIEVGHINYSPVLQKTIAGTEAMYLMMRNVFESGYRRYEWKCDALNAASRSAALRLGFTFEGVFRQAAMYKQRNRDTAWYSVIDREWPAVDAAYREWLSPDNFEAGRQTQSLSELMRRCRHTGAAAPTGDP